MVTAADIQVGSCLILNPDLHIAELDEDGRLSMGSPCARAGAMYPRAVETRSSHRAIPVDALFSQW